MIPSKVSSGDLGGTCGAAGSGPSAFLPESLVGSSDLRNHKKSQQRQSRKGIQDQDPGNCPDTRILANCSGAV